MKVVSDQKKIARNVKITKITLYTSLIVLGLGFVVSIGTPNTLPNLIIAVIILIIGYILFRVNSGMNVRWGTSPRQDEKLMAAFKGLPNEFTFYNYSSPLPFMLVGSSGIWVFEMVDANGIIYFDEASLKWKTKKQGGFLRRFLTSDQVGDLRKALKLLDEKWEKFKIANPTLKDLPKPNEMMVLINTDTEIEGKDPEMELVRIDKIKEQIRRVRDLPSDEWEEIQKLVELLPQSVS
jgi:hypothetical protein